MHQSCYPLPKGVWRNLMQRKTKRGSWKKKLVMWVWIAKAIQTVLPHHKKHALKMRSPWKKKQPWQKACQTLHFWEEGQDNLLEVAAAKRNLRTWRRIWVLLWKRSQHTRTLGETRRSWKQKPLAWQKLVVNACQSPWQKGQARKKVPWPKGLAMAESHGPSCWLLLQEKSLGGHTS